MQKEEIAEINKRLKRLEKVIMESKETSKPKVSTKEIYSLPIENTSRRNVFKKLIPSLLTIFFLTALLMTVYEFAKQALTPDITIWQSHTITIIFASIIAPFASYFALKNIELLRIKTKNELIERRKAEHELQEMKEELEVRVKKRTSELYAMNEKLNDEIKIRKQAEEEIRKYAEELLSNRDLLEKRTEELSELNRKLSISEQSLMESNASKDKFFSIIAHDLKSPLTSLFGFSELLINEINKLSTEEIKTYTFNIREVTSSILNLLDNLLNWARMQSGSVKIEKTNFDLEPVILNILRLQKISIDKKGLNIEFDSDKATEVYGDKNMIETVCRNLISNAVKFTPRGGNIKIKIKCDTDKVKFCVEDSGVGIPEDTLNKLFSIEEKISTKGTENEQGTGLGLVLCKEFLLKNNSDIFVNSTLNKGSKFYFKMPTKQYTI